MSMQQENNKVDEKYYKVEIVEVKREDNICWLYPSQVWVIGEYKYILKHLKSYYLDKTYIKSVTQTKSIPSAYINDTGYWVKCGEEARVYINDEYYLKELMNEEE